MGVSTNVSFKMVAAGSGAAVGSIMMMGKQQKLHEDISDLKAKTEFML